MSYFLQGLRSDIRQLVDMNEPKTFAEAEKAARFAASVSRVLQPANKSSSSEQGLLIKLLNHEPASQPSNSEDKMLSIMEQNKSLVAKLSGKRNGAGLLTVKGAVSREVFYVFCVNYARIIKVHSLINKKPLNGKKGITAVYKM